MNWSSVALFAQLIVSSSCMQKTSINIPQEICTILEENDIYDARIVHLGNYDKCVLDNLEITVNEEDVSEYMDILLESFTERIPITDRTIVKKDDVVYVSYTVYQNGDVIHYVDSDVLVVGSNYYNKEFEEALIGRKIGEPFIVEIPVMDNTDFSFNIVIKSINSIKKYELSEEFVQEKMGMETIEEFYEFCYNKVYRDKQQQQKQIAEQKLWESIFELCEYSLDKEEIAAYSLYLIEGKEKIAYAYNLTLEEYIKDILQKQESAFYEEQYEYGEYEIKKYLTVGAIYQDLNLSISDEEYRNICTAMECNYEETKRDIYLDAMITYQIMQNKVWDFLNR